MGSKEISLCSKMALVGVFFIAAACSNDGQMSGVNGSGRTGGIFSTLAALTSPHATAVTVVDDTGKPVAGAQVLIGTALNAPFAGNFVTTAADGTLAALPGWTAAQTVTISAPNHYRVTYFAQSPNGQTLVMQSIPAPAAVGLTGTTPGITPVDESDVCDFSLVIPGLHRADILHFNIGMIVSSKDDTISVFGNTINIPSNVTIPKQTQDYYFPIDLDKPNYELSFGQSGSQTLFALHGQFPFKDTVGAIRDGDAFYTLVNKFTFLDGGVMNVNVTAANQSLNIPVTQFQFSQANAIKSPTVGSDEVMYGAALQTEQGVLVPTDVRQLTSGGQDTLHTIPGSTEQLLAVVKKQSEMAGVAGMGAGLDHLSATIIPLSAGVAPVTLPMLAAPTAVSSLEVKTVAPANTANVAPVATYATLSKVVTAATATTAETTTLIWEAYAPNWATDVHLPTWPNEAAPSGSLRWAVAMLGGLSNSQVDLGPSLMQSVTHVTKSAVDF